jgi:type II secretory pathway component PulF
MSMHAHIWHGAFPMMAFFGVEAPGDFAASGFLWLLLYILPLALAAFAVYKCFSGPLRRKEQTRMFLDLLEAEFRQGQGPEIALVQAAQTGDRSLGWRFQQLADHLRAGARLSQALDEVPSLLPPQVTATLRVGEEVGDVRKVLPACRNFLQDADSQTRNGFNFLVISSLFTVMPILLLILNAKVFPIFIEFLAGAGANQPPPAATELVMRIGLWVAGAQLLLAFCLWCWVWFYVRGPRAYGWVRVDGRKSSVRPLWNTPLWNFIGRPLAPLRDRILYALPWRRRRLQRDFCATLSILLDAETPETAAITLAAESTANYVFVKRARRALEDLSAGRTLQLALQRFDNAGEFSWRLANAAAQQGGFLPALSGWMEALDAKAFQQEQTASQLITTGLVLCNGLVVGLIATGIFAVLISIEG